MVWIVRFASTALALSAAHKADSAAVRAAYGANEQVVFADLVSQKDVAIQTDPQALKASVDSTPPESLPNSEIEEPSYDALDKRSLVNNNWEWRRTAKDKRRRRTEQNAAPSIPKNRKRGKAASRETPDDSFQRLREMLSTAKKSISLVSRGIYEEGGNYLKDPWLRKALGYFCGFVVLFIVVAYAEHRENLLSIQEDFIRQRIEHITCKENELDAERKALEQAIAESKADMEEQERQQQELKANEEHLRMREEAVKNSKTATMREKIALSVREAKAKLAAHPDGRDWTELEVEMARSAAIKQVDKLKEETRRLIWEGGMQRANSQPPAMSAMALTEAVIRATRLTIRRAMALEDKPLTMEEQIAKMKENQSDTVLAFALQLHSALRTLNEDEWVAFAEKKMLKDPHAKDKLIRGLEAEWTIEQEHQRRILEQQEKGRRELRKIREAVEVVKQSLADHPKGDIHRALKHHLFRLSSEELQRQIALRILAAEAESHLDGHSWKQKMMGLLDEAEDRCRQRQKAWSTTYAARMELDGRIVHIRQMMEALLDKLEMCTKIQNDRDEEGN